MTAHIMQRPHIHAPHYDPIEILMAATGVVLVVVMAFTF